jgi:hypothetical protein
MKRAKHSNDEHIVIHSAQVSALLFVQIEMVGNRALDAGEVSACCNRGELDQQYNGAQLGELASGNVSPNAKYA